MNALTIRNRALIAKMAEGIQGAKGFGGLLNQVALEEDQFVEDIGKVRKDLVTKHPEFRTLFTSRHRGRLFSKDWEVLRDTPLQKEYLPLRKVLVLVRYQS